MHLKAENKIFGALLAGSALLPLAYAWLFLSNRVLPWWSDPGEWLKYANALEAYIASSMGLKSHVYEMWLQTMWEQGALQYPPLFFLMLIPLKALIGPIYALKLLGTVLFALQPIPTYFLAEKITGSRVGGVVAAYTAALMPMHAEMLGWGGYPNLLGFILLASNIYFTVSAMGAPRAGSVLLMILTSVMVPMAHHLASIVHMGVLIFWIMLLTALGETSGIRFPACSLAAGLTTSVLYRLFPAYPPQFVVFNEAAYYSLRVNPAEALSWAMKLPVLVLLIAALAALIILKRNSLLRREIQALLLAWTLFPVVATQGYLLGVAIDYNRIFFFLTQLIPLVVAAPFALKEHSTLPPKLARKDPASFSAMALSVIVAPATLLTGLVTMANVNGWYSSMDPYGDREKLSALNWISHNTPVNAVFVAEEHMGRWIEGYASRRTMLLVEPRFLFIDRQLERYYVASSVLLATVEARNGYLRILDQTGGSVHFSPIICLWSRGEYKEALIVDDGPLAAYMKNWTSTLHPDPEGHTINSTYVWVEGNMEKNVTKTITLNKNIVRIRYDINNVGHAVSLNVNVSRERALSLIEIMGSQVRMHTDIGEVVLNTNSFSVQNDGRNIKLSFNPPSAILEISAGGHAENEKFKETLIVEQSQLLKEHGISHIVVPRASGDGVLTIPKYMHLLKNHKIVYVNDKVVILKTDGAED